MADRFQNPDSDTLDASSSDQTNAMATTMTVTQVNSFRDVIYLCYLEGNKLHQNQHKVCLPIKNTMATLRT